MRLGFAHIHLLVVLLVIEIYMAAVPLLFVTVLVVLALISSMGVHFTIRMRAPLIIIVLLILHGLYALRLQFGHACVVRRVH